MTSTSSSLADSLCQKRNMMDFIFFHGTKGRCGVNVPCHLSRAEIGARPNPAVVCAGDGRARKRVGLDYRVAPRGKRLTKRDVHARHFHRGGASSKGGWVGGGGVTQEAFFFPQKWSSSPSPVATTTTALPHLWASILAMETTEVVPASPRANLWTRCPSSLAAAVVVAEVEGVVVLVLVVVVHLYLLLLEEDERKISRNSSPK